MANTVVKITYQIKCMRVAYMRRQKRKQEYLKIICAYLTNINIHFVRSYMHVTKMTVISFDIKKVSNKC